MSGAGVLPAGAVFIGRCLFTVATSGANVQVFQQVAIINGSPAVANVGLYCVLNDNPNLQDSYNKAWQPGIAAREEATTTIFGMAAGDYKFDLYAMTNANPCETLFVGIFPLIFYA